MTGRPATADDGDLTRIPGIGSRTADQLRAAGVGTVSQLAAATPERLAAAIGRRPGYAQRTAEWIRSAAGLLAASGGTGRPAAVRRRPRRTFTVEVQVDGEPDRVVATRVVHLESQDTDTWSGWSRQRLLAFLEARIAPAAVRAEADAPTAGTDAEGAPRGGETDANTAPPGSGRGTAADPAPPGVLGVHRFGILESTAPARTGRISARLRLDPADLDLPSGLGAMARVKLLGRGGTTGSLLLDSRDVAVPAKGVVETVLGGDLPRSSPSCSVFATVRVLVASPAGRPQEGLGSARLDVTGGEVSR
jgi:hypothetical protein